MERKACCHVVNAVLSRLNLIRLISRMKMSKTSTKCILPKCSWCQGVNFPNKTKLFLFSYFLKEILIFSYSTSPFLYTLFLLQEFYIKQGNSMGGSIFKKEWNNTELPRKFVAGAQPYKSSHFELHNGTFRLSLDLNSERDLRLLYIFSLESNTLL